jgi:ComF family protein
MATLIDLVLPTPCVLCQKIGEAMCKNCVSDFEIIRNVLTTEGLSGYSFCSYTTKSAALVNAIKEQGQTSLIKFMAEFMTSSWPEEYLDAVLVPIPSSLKNLKKRGFSHTELLSRRLARELGVSSVGSLLVSTKARADQVGLSFPEREENLNGAFRGDLRAFHGKNRQVVLIDDVFTSGATLRQAWRTLEELGVQVLGFCVFAQIALRKPLFTGQERLS